MTASRRRRVVVTDSTFPTVEAERQAATEAGADFAAHQCKTADDVASVTAGADVVLVQFASMGEGALAGLAEHARVIRYGVGYDNVDLAAAARAGVSVAYVPDYCTAEVADHTATMILATLRKLAALDESVRSGRWEAVATLRPTPAFTATTVGFVGLGRIGRAVLERLRAFSFIFLVLDPALDEGTAATLGVRRAMDLDDLLTQADIVTLHAPSSPATYGMINATTLGRMKPTAAIVNTARGDLVDAAALAEALRSGRLSAAALDVFSEEPLPAASPLRAAPGVMLSPHAAWYSETSIDRLQELAADEVRRALAGQPARCPVPAPRAALLGNG